MTSTEQNKAENITNDNAPVTKQENIECDQDRNKSISYFIKAPHLPDAIKITTLDTEMVHEIKLYLMELAELRGLSCFHLEFNGILLDDGFMVRQCWAFY